ncbi:M13-type metalloendopeptidase [Schleiferilactobacillus perolens]|jgi:putative endopeptidase|uniref:M13-type metalloendopeptidase n=1 Tax=Schleiferilactobacillus perolens TaxID=100468 RepID=UPI0023544D51|nr:M13 family metallopeptidase [Schleiferilactobacillus perolens]MCI2170474.1 M13 family metallopeptidase [Schleiferilactobacillus perolens]
MREQTSTRVQDDLYDYVNGDWQATAPIDPDKVAAGVSEDLDKKVEKELTVDLQDALKQADDAPTDNFEKAALLFGKALDFDRREKEGLAPEQPRLTKLQKLSDLTRFNAALPDLIQNGYPLPFRLFPETNFHHADQYQLMFDSPNTILPDVTMYADAAQKEPLLAAWTKMVRTLLAQTDLLAADQEAYTQDALAFDALIATHHMSHEDMADDNNIDNATDWSDMLAKMPQVDVANALAPILPSTPKQVNIVDTRFYDAFAAVFNATTYRQYNHWAYINELLRHTALLSPRLREIGAQYDQAITGQKELAKPVRFAYELANRYMAEPIGVYYGKKYFGPKAKADVTQLVEQLIAAYKEQIAENTWLSASTKQMATKKLDTMVIKMGYPEKAQPIYDKIQIDREAALSPTVDALQRILRLFGFGRLDAPVDRSEWVMPAQLVNAAYNPTSNDITFPAAILQAPFYDVHASEADNLGGAGATIGHEISHAFDNNGALYDEHGNKKNWWQPADFDHFKQFTQAMIDQFDGIPYAGGKINGKLVVSENIADNAGLNAALRVLHKLSDDQADFKEYFINYALSWRTKIRPELERVILSTDVHSPAKLRTNVPVPNFPEWYRAFHVEQGDGMYRDPGKRVVIW